MWDINGLECIFDTKPAFEEIESWEKEAMWDALKEKERKPRPNPIPLQQMILRARFNSQRSYEIYEFASQLKMDKVKELFDTNPQSIVDWIRQNGHKIYSDYSGKSKTIN